MSDSLFNFPRLFFCLSFSLSRLHCESDLDLPPHSREVFFEFLQRLFLACGSRLPISLSSFQASSLWLSEKGPSCFPDLIFLGLRLSSHLPPSYLSCFSPLCSASCTGTVDLPHLREQCLHIGNSKYLTT